MCKNRREGSDAPVLLIAIVDDDPRDSGQLSECVEEYFRRNATAVMIRVFNDGLDFIRSPDNHDIVFLDIRMNRLDGLDAARILRKINHETILIFVTNMAQFAIKGYEVDALDFIVKPATQASIDYVLDKAMRRLDGVANVTCSIKTPEGTVNLSANDITYVEVFDHNLVYHTVRGEYSVRGRLADVAEKLDPARFVLCNRSFIVNLRHVSSVTSTYLLIGNTRISVSQSHRKELMQRFSSFLGDSL